MKNIGMSLYYYQRVANKRSPAEKISDAIEKAISEFGVKYGYCPEGIIIREDEVNGNFHSLREEYKDIEFVLVSAGCTPSHFMLFPVVDKRIPRILKVKRSPVL